MANDTWNKSVQSRWAWLCEILESIQDSIDAISGGGGPIDSDDDVPTIQAFQAQSALSQAAIQQAIIDASTQNNTDLVNLLTEALVHTSLLNQIAGNVVLLNSIDNTLDNIDDSTSSIDQIVDDISDELQTFASNNSLELQALETVLQSIDGRVLTSNALLTQLSVDISDFATQNSLDLTAVVGSVNAVTSALQPLLSSIDTNLAAVLVELQNQLPAIITELQGLDDSSDLTELLAIIVELEEVNTNVLAGNSTLDDFYVAFQAYQVSFDAHALVLSNFAAGNQAALAAINTLLTTANATQNAILVELTDVGLNIADILLTLQTELPDIIQELQNNGTQNALDLAAILSELQSQTILSNSILSTVSSINGNLVDMEALLTSIDSNTDGLETLLANFAVQNNVNFGNVISSISNLRNDVQVGFAQNDADNATIIARLVDLFNSSQNLESTASSLLVEVTSIDQDTTDILNELISQSGDLTQLITDFQANTATNQLNTGYNLSSLGELQSILAEIQTLIANESSDNAAIVAGLSAVEAEIIQAASDVVQAVQLQFDYEGDPVQADTDGRIIIRRTWTNKTTQAQTITYTEVDGTPVADGAVADPLAELDLFTAEIEYTTPSNGTSVIVRRVTYRIESDGTWTEVYSQYFDSSDNPLFIVPLTLWRKSETELNANDTLSPRSIMIKSQVGSSTVASLGSIIGTFSLRSFSITAVSLNEPTLPPTYTDNFGNITEFVGTFGINFGNDGDYNSPLVNLGTINVPATTNADSNILIITAIN